MRIPGSFTHARVVALAAALCAAACRSAPSSAGGSGRELSAEAGERAAGPALGSARALAPEEIVIAAVDGEPLTLADAMGTFSSSHSGHAPLVRGAPAVRELAGRIIEQRLFLAEARALGIPDEEDLRADVEDYRYRRAAELFWKRAVDEKVQVPDQEVEAFYAKTDVALRLALIEVESRERAEVLRARVAAGEDVRALARSESIHASAAIDGILDFVGRGDLDPALEEAAFALEELGSLSPVVATAKGFTFVRLEQRTVNPSRPAPEVALPQIRAILERRAQDELRAAADERLAEEAGISVDESLLDPSVLLSQDRPEAVVAKSAGDELELGVLRELLNLDTIRSVPEAEARKGAGAVAREWARQRALRREVARTGLLEDPEVARKAAAYEIDLVLKLLYRDYVYAGVNVSEEDARAYYEAHKQDEFTRPAEVRLSYMVLATDEDARAALERVQSGEAFADVAREVSIDPTSAAHGGSIGWVKRGQLLEQIEPLVFAMAPEEVRGPMSTALGHFVVKVFERKEPVLIPFESFRRTATRRATTELQKRAYASWLSKLKERASARIDDEGVRLAVEWLERQVPPEQQGPPALEPAEPPAEPGRDSGPEPGPAPGVERPPETTEEEQEEVA